MRERREGEEERVGIVLRVCVVQLSGEEDEEQEKEEKVKKKGCV